MSEDEIITTPEQMEEGTRRTLRERVARLLDPERGINRHEFMELLGIMYPKARAKMERLFGDGKLPGITYRRHTSLFWLSGRAAFASWFSQFMGWDLPEWFLEEPEATMALGMLVTESMEKK